MSVAVHIIEDDPAVRDALCQLLAMEGRKVCAYASPEAFFASPSPEPQDVIVLDIHFPVGSGVDVAKRLKHDHPKTRIVVISSLRAGLLARALIAIEPLASFRKPVDPAAITACIRGLAADT